MSKKDQLKLKLNSIINDSKKLEEFLIKNSNLPGPRANLELLYAFAEVYENVAVLKRWIKITDKIADANDPKSFLPFCAAACIGKIYTKTGNKELITILKEMSNDSRWRTREAVAFAFQYIGENNFDDLKTIFNKWIKKSNNLEKRAMIVALAHPPMLNEERADYCFEILENVVATINRSDNFDVLKKGLEFVISVYTVYSHAKGFAFLKSMIGKDKSLNTIVKANLKKNRILKRYPEEVNKLAAML